MIAVLFFYAHRMDDRVFIGGVFTFVGVPLIAGSLQQQAYRSVMLVSLVLLFLCPVVYAITDPLAAQFEKMRDGYFLATSSSIIYVSANWLANSLRTSRLVPGITSALTLVVMTIAVFILLWMVIYLE
jgi:hypothetical protein